MKDTQAIFNMMLESKKARNKAKTESIKRYKKEAEEAPVEFEGQLVKAQETDNTVMDDVIDNIQVVTDPEKTVDELEKRADDIQDAIEDSPEGEEAFSDEYIGDKVYACPVCGESFFSEEDYNQGDVCPICKAEPTDGFLLQGVVAAAEELPVEETESDIEPDDSEEPEADAAETEYVQEPEQDSEPSGEGKEESYNKKYKVVTECDNGDCGNIEVTIDLDDNEIEVTKPAQLEAEIDETTFEDTLNQFAEENYSGTIEDIKVTDASYDPSKDELCLDCVAECTNGRHVPMQFKLVERKCVGNRAILAARETRNVLKVESKSPAFNFNVRNDNGVLRCESMKYNFTTTHSTAGRVKVEGYCRAKKVRV